MIQKMPSPVGHVLGGATVGLLLARDPGWRLPIICAVAATLPDADFLLPVAHRGPTHSLVGALAAGAAALALSRVFTSAASWRLAAAVALAVLTHVLFDWLSEDSS